MTDNAGMHPRQSYPASMEQPPRVYAERSLMAEAAALAGESMFDCTRFPGQARLSERQCLVNQARAQAGGFPSFCVDCPTGREVRARHPEGVKLEVHRHPSAADRCLMIAREPAKTLTREEGKPTSLPTACPQEPTPPSPQPSPPSGEGEMPVGASVDASVDRSVDQPLIVPLCPKHGVEKTADKRGYYKCLKCVSENSRAMWDRRLLDGRRAKEIKVPRKAPPELEAPRCPQHPERPQYFAGGSFKGRCLECLQEQARETAKIRKANNTARKEAGKKPAPPRCPTHPDQAQIMTAGEPQGVCRICLQTEKVQVAKPGMALPSPANLGRGKAKVRCQADKPPAAPPPGAADFLAKLPDFDPAWPDEIKVKWFEAFKGNHILNSR